LEYRCSLVGDGVPIATDAEITSADTSIPQPQHTHFIENFSGSANPEKFSSIFHGTGVRARALSGHPHRSQKPDQFCVLRRSGAMSEVQKPSCPLCSREMRLKQVFRQQPFDHYVFKCTPCGLEYPVVKKANTDGGLSDPAAGHP
jgi:hypothetical protein